MLRHLESNEGQLLLDWLGDVRIRENRKLMESKDIAELHRAQGSIGVIDLIKSLPDDLRQYERDVSSGKIKPLKEG
jgi:hypothetical protein